MVGPLLALLVDVYLEEDDLVGAESVAVRLGALAKTQRDPYLKAAAALAKGRVCTASKRGDARICLHEAIEEFARAQLPMELARARLELARALSERSPQVAIAESRAALEDFERLQAARHADEASALLRSLGAPTRSGPKGVGALTKREAEVLELMGAVQSRDRRSSLHQQKDGRAPCRQRAVKARSPQPGRGRCSRDSRKSKPLDRGPHRCFVPDRTSSFS